MEEATNSQIIEANHAGGGEVNKTKIEWCDYTWNPITGCLNNCFYCYGRKIYERFKKDFTPQIHYDRLSEPLKCHKPSKIFVCSMGDFWGKTVLPIWREEVYNTIKACPNHTFLILTKQPQNIEDTEKIPENVWVGMTITDESYSHSVSLRNIENSIRFISFEPLLGAIDFKYLYWVDWVIIGAMTGQGSGKFAPKKEWIQDIVNHTRKFKIPLFLKNNLKWHEKIQEFPITKPQGA